MDIIKTNRIFISGLRAESHDTQEQIYNTRTHKIIRTKIAIKCSENGFLTAQFMDSY